MSLQGGFSADYEVDGDDRQWSEGIEYEFRPRKAAAENGLSLEIPRAELVLRVRPTGMSAWRGRFFRGPGKFSGVYTTPSPATVCVIAGGQGYWIDVAKPNHYDVVRCMPIQFVVPAPAHRLLVFFDFVRAAAYGSDGYLWMTDDLSWDGVTFDEIDRDSLNGQGWDSPEERHVPFSVDLRTGESQGGSSPAKYRA